MFWLLILILFGEDGSKSVQTKPEPTEAACEADIAALVSSLKADKPVELLGAGVKCDGPFNDPTVRKSNP